MPICTVCGTLMHADDVAGHVHNAGTTPAKGSPVTLSKTVL